ncbi:aspartate/glutamate/uridylate kinase [Methanocaldococcus villosus KIN24-T80]|uniref:Aspartate/glutamate/uridylate kinase n=1 Tax=Methanocaldococcus villosus KIN24-T80 TaxID=1069083 RepID=N6VR91_9EURY|nr:[5-(aminomethyl)furan-3-yl]methyl phosphate kinase [Methanocaldococcus villosus]ENN96420.1 aspartate/glutamate/uridylate kinase [Methanocaldococcus villosus KIN24-T80]
MNIIKIGGSLTYYIKPLLESLKSYKREEIIIIPGGGKFADTLREIDKNLSLSPSISHKLAIKCMDILGEVFSDIGGIKAYDNLFDLKREIKKERIAILLPSKLLLSTDISEHSWNVTSDSLTLYISKFLNVKNIIIATDVDGIYDKYPEGKLLNIIKADMIKGLTAVDEYFPTLLKSLNKIAYVVNGKYPERIIDILEGRNTICTKIIP